MSIDLTASWLKQNTSIYRNSQSVYIDVLAVLERYPSLRPKTDVYTYDDGRSQLLLCVHGLIPIAFRNASYNIPVAIWVTLVYPAEPPLVYVVPTSDMLIKSSAHVDLSGKCTFEYTDNWSRKPDSCSLLALVEAMQLHFSKEPPLYSKPRPKPTFVTPGQSLDPSHSQSVSAASEYGHVHQLPGPPRLPPKPFNTSGIVPATLLTTSSTNLSSSPSTPRQPTSRTVAHHAPSTAPAYTSSVPNATGVDPTPVTLHERLPPPVPPHPPELASPYPSRTIGSSPVDSAFPQQTSNKIAQGVEATGLPPYSLSYSSSLHPSSGHGTFTEQPRSADQVPLVPPRPSYSHTGLTFGIQQQGNSLPLPSNTDSPPLTLPPLHSLPSHAYTRPQSQPMAASGLISTEEKGYSTGNIPVYSPNPTDAPKPIPGPKPYISSHSSPVPDLLDEEVSLGPASTVPTSSIVPPKPPNPQTLALHNALLNAFRESLARMATTHEEATARQRVAQAELLKGPAAINDESARLVAVRDVCHVVSTRWESLVQEGERALEEVRKRGEVGVDEMVCASSIVGNQLANLVAEDNAIEDTMYYLHRALNSGRIDLERFLRTTRVLAEEQFMKRALAEKIVNGLPIGSLFGP